MTVNAANKNSPEVLARINLLVQQAEPVSVLGVMVGVAPHGDLFFFHLFRVENHFCWSSGGLRYASITGYCLTAFQAETPPAYAGGSDKSSTPAIVFPH